MDGENKGKPYFLMDDLGVKSHIFDFLVQHPYLVKSVAVEKFEGFSQVDHGLADLWNRPFKNPNVRPFEPRKKHWLVGLYRGLYYPNT